MRFTEPPRQQSPTVPDHGIRARTHHAGKRQSLLAWLKARRLPAHSGLI